MEDCSICSGSGYLKSAVDGVISFSFCACKNGLRERYRVPEMYLDWTIDTWPGPDRVLKEIAGWSKTRDWMIIAGPTGVGKTGLAVSLYRSVVDNFIAHYGEHALIIQHVRPFQFWRASDLIEREKETFGIPGAVSKLAQMADVPFLVLDDVGAERGTDFNADAIAQLIARRHALGKRTIITTNMSSQELQDYLGMRTLDRLRENSVLVLLSGDTRRQWKRIVK